MGSATLMAQAQAGCWEELATSLAKLTADQYDITALLARALLYTYGPETSRNVTQALTDLETACQLAPDNSQYLSTLSELQLQAGQHQQALATAQQARRVDNGNGMAAIALGRAAWACKHIPLARHSFQAASQLLPEDASHIRQQLNSMSFRLAPFWWQPVQGKRLTLVRMTAAHYEFVLKCRNNAAFQQRYNLFQPASRQAVKKDLQQAEQHPLENNHIEWVVEKQGVPIGLAALTDLSMEHSRAELLVGFPGTPTPFNSVEATLLVLEFAFATLGLQKIYSHVYASNPHSQRSSIHIGFEQEGVLRSHIKAPNSNKRLDLYANGYLPDKFYKRSKTTRLFKRLLGRSARHNLNNPDYPPQS